MEPSARRLTQFFSRYRWSVLLASLSALSFARLAKLISGEELGEVDRSAMTWVWRARGPLDTPMLLLTWLGTPRCLVTIALLTLLALLWLRRRREAAFLATAGLGTMLLLLALKAFFQRSRPDDTALYLLQTPSSFSFPSGHALGTTGVLLSLLVLARVRGLRRLPFALVALLGLFLIVGVALSRVYFGVHYPSDVVGGVLAGAGWIAAATGYFFPRALPGENRAPPDAESMR